MSITQLAPGEKSEHLIYAILPLSVATWLLIQLEITPLNLTLVSLGTSFLALLLFEVPIDEFLVKSVVRRLTGSHHGFQKRRFLLWNILLQSWEGEIFPFDPEVDEKRLEKDISNMSEAIVSSSLISPRLWRLRAEFYFVLSLWPLVASCSDVLNRLEGSESVTTLSWSGFIVSSAAILRQYGLLVMIGFMIFLAATSVYRQRHLSSHIRYLSQFRYLQRNMSIDRMKRPGVYRPEKSKSEWKDQIALYAVWEGIELLNDIALRPDWTIFSDHAARWSQALSRTVSQDFEQYGIFYLVDLWARLVEPRIDTENESGQIWDWLQWAHYYYRKLLDYEKTQVKSKRRWEFWRSVDDDCYPKSEKSLQIVITHINTRLEKGSDGPEEPNSLLQALVETEPNSKAFAAILWALGGFPHVFGPLYEAAFTNGLQSLLTSFNDESGGKFAPVLLAKAIIHVFKGSVPTDTSGVWGEREAPIIRLRNFLNALEKEADDLEPVVRHFIQRASGISLREVKKDTQVMKCIRDLGLMDEPKMG